MGEKETSIGSMTATIVAAYVSRHRVDKDDLPNLLHSVYRSLLDLAGDVNQSLPASRRTKPAVVVHLSIGPDYLICLQDGKKYKSLKRHLRVQHQLSPSHYREKWNLPANYPMVAPSYSKKRSRIARALRLGRRRHI